MSSGIEIDGFEDLEELLQDMTITEADEKRAMKKAIEPIADEVERNTPERTSRLKKSVIKSIKREGFATIGIVRLGKFYDIFQEFGTSQQKAHIGFFERSVNKKAEESLSILSKELLK